MLFRSGGAEQTRLRMGDELDRDRGHEIFEPPLGNKAFGKARPHQMVPNPEAEPARDHHPARALREREVARDAAERQAKAIDGGGSAAVFLLHAARPDRHILPRRHPAPLPPRQRFIYIDAPAPRYDAFRRPASVAPPETPTAR